jgi:glycopeptide antibiotics resistance protein
VRVRQVVGLIGLIGFGAIVGIVTLSPARVDLGNEYLIERILLELHERGAPSWFEYNELEFTANIALFVPLGMFLGFLMLRHRWLGALALGLASYAIENLQLHFLPERVADTRDLIANTIGGCIGLVIAALMFPREKKRRFSAGG